MTGKGQKTPEAPAPDKASLEGKGLIAGDVEAGRWLFAQPCEFMRGVVDLNGLPPISVPEIAFAGRSNVGKSSLVNALTGRSTLARTSNTPGRTQQLNFFELGPQGKAALVLVDLPGYGFAKVPDKIRLHWENLLSRYLRERAQLKGLVLIMDARHPLTELDVRMLDWFSPTGKPVHVLLTKSDKLSRQECIKVQREVGEFLKAYPNCSLQLFSSLKKTGTKEAEEVMAKWLA
jgi:GTP-binding protein